MENVVLTQLSIPEIRQLFRQELETYFDANKQTEASIQKDQWFDLDALETYLPEKLARATLYGKLASGELPGHKRGKKWYFLKSEIDNYLKEGRKKTNAESALDAEVYLQSKMKRG